jgi:hypothetical protein
LITVVASKLPLVPCRINCDGKCRLRRDTDAGRADIQQSLSRQSLTEYNMTSVNRLNGHRCAPLASSQRMQGCDGGPDCKKRGCISLFKSKSRLAIFYWRSRMPVWPTES